MGPVAMTMVGADTEEYRHAEKVLTVCVLSIIITVPTGALLTTLLGPRFLTKTKYTMHTLTLPEIKRRYSRRPSMRDISIIEEDEEEDIDEDIEKEKDKTEQTLNV